VQQQQQQQQWLTYLRQTGDSVNNRVAVLHYCLVAGSYPQQQQQGAQHLHAIANCACANPATTHNNMQEVHANSILLREQQTAGAGIYVALTSQQQ
jgi:hypothetical protein